ncbi:MAG: M48 family metalloprotease [Sporichthyaceae bacterium]
MIDRLPAAGPFGVLVLLVLTCVAGRFVDHRLSGRRWTSRRPLAALTLWHCCAAATIAGLVGAPLLLAHDVLERGLVALLHADIALVHHRYGRHAEFSAWWNLAALGPVLFASALAATTARRVGANRRVRDLHRARCGAQRSAALPASVLALPARVSVVPDTAPQAYCLPGGLRRRGHIVFTTAAVDLLGDAEKAAVAEHELAHLRGRHHAATVLADALAMLTRRVGMLTNYPAEVRRLHELVADDAAARAHGHALLAGALLKLSNDGRSRIATTTADLAAAQSDVAARIRRLIAAATQPPDRPPAAGIAVGAGLLLALLPILVVLGPAVPLIGSAH